MGKSRMSSPSSMELIDAAEACWTIARSASSSRGAAILMDQATQLLQCATEGCTGACKGVLHPLTLEKGWCPLRG